MESVEELSLGQNEASFSDESFRQGDWFKHVVLAQISKKDDLIWFLKLKKYSSSELGTQKDEKGTSTSINEIKGNQYYRAFSKFDPIKKREIWQSLKNVVIIIEDPKQYFDGTGFTPIPQNLNGAKKKLIAKSNFGFMLNFEGKTFVVNTTNPIFSHFKRFLLNYVFMDIRSSSPLYKIESDIKIMNDYFWTHMQIPQIFNLFEQSYKKSDDVFKRIEKSTIILARLQSAFWDYPKLTNILKEQNNERFFPYAIYNSYKSKLQDVITRQKVFDDGHENTIELMKKAFVEIDNSINEFEQTNWIPQILEQPSYNTIEIQAADFASYMARIIYDKDGVKEVRRYFKTVLFNGKSSIQ